MIPDILQNFHVCPSSFPYVLKELWSQRHTVSYTVILSSHIYFLDCNLLLILTNFRVELVNRKIMALLALH